MKDMTGVPMHGWRAGFLAGLWLLARSNPHFVVYNIV